MDPAWVATITVIIINIFGWGISWGKLNGRVKTLEMLTERQDKILNDGLVGRLAELSRECAGLKGTIDTYINLHKEGKER